MKLAHLLLALALAACEAAPEPKADAPPPPAAPEPFDLDGYCQEMCGRAAECSMQAAEGPAALGGKATETALQELRQKSPALAAECTAGCLTTPIDDEHRGAALRAKRCLSELACAELEKCLAGI